MARRNTGGFLSATEQATDANSANGIFTLQEAAVATAAGNFPTGRWTPSRSLRFRSSASAYLNRTPSVAGNQQKFTISAWVKLGVLGGSRSFINCWSGNEYFDFRMDSSNQLYVLAADASGSVITNISTPAYYRDTSAWYHVMVSIDTTQSVSTNRVVLYVNGIQPTTTYTTSPAQNYSYILNSTNLVAVGKRAIDATQFMDGYLSEVNLIDGQKLAPSSFGQIDPETGAWVPKKYTGTYGTTGFYLPFSQTQSTLNYGTYFGGTTGTDYVSIPYSSDFELNTGDWTIDFWVNPAAATGSYRMVTGWGPNSSNFFGLTLFDNGTNYSIQATYIQGGANYAFNYYPATYDILPNQWSHVVLQRSGNAVFCYINGILRRYNATGGANVSAVGSGTFYLGQRYDATLNMKGYISNFRLIKGQALYSASNTTVGTQYFPVPNSPATTTSDGAVGSNVKLLALQSSTFVDNSGTSKSLTGAGTAVNVVNTPFGVGLGEDGSGNQNRFTTNNISTTAGATYDLMVDVPGIGSTTAQPDVGGVVRGNYCVLNPTKINSSGAVTYSNANFTVSHGSGFTSTGGSYCTPGTIAFNAGKFYWEVKVDYQYSNGAFSCDIFAGVNELETINNNTGSSPSTSRANDALFYFGTRQLYNIGTSGYTSTTSVATGDIVGIAVDMDNGKIFASVNGVWINSGNPATGVIPGYLLTPGITVVPVFGNSTASTAWNEGYTVNFGQRAFAYTPPTGFKSLNTTNLPNPIIKRSTDHFDVKTYSGNSAQQQIGVTNKQSTTYPINKSLRFKPTTSSSMSRGFGTPTDSTKFTWSGWVKRTQIAAVGGSAGYQTFFAGLNGSDFMTLGFSNASGGYGDYVAFDNYVQGSGFPVLMRTNAIFKDTNTWYHIVAVWDSGSFSSVDRTQIWVNGVRCGVTYGYGPVSASLASTINSAGTSVRLGTYNGSYFWPGQMAEVNFVDGQALTPTSFGQFDANNNWVPKSYAGTYGNNGFYLPFNAPSLGTSSYAAQFGTTTTSQLVTSTNASLALGTNNFTVEYWFTRDDLASGGEVPVSFGNGINTYDSLFGYSSSGGMLIYMSSNNSSWDIVSGVTIAQNLAAKTWYHMAITRSGSTFTSYLNGTQSATWTSASSIYQSANSVAIGKAQNNPTSLKGLISNVRVVIGSVLYTGNFTPSTTPLTAVTNTKLLTLQNSTIVDNSTNALTFTNTSVPATQPVYPFAVAPTYSVQVGGSSAVYANQGATSAFALSSGTNYTYEFYVYFTTAIADGNTRFLFDARSASSTASMFMAIETSGIWTVSGAMTSVANPFTVTGQWYHVAITRSSGTVRLFVNGVQKATGTDTGTTSSDKIWLGSRYSSDNFTKAGTYISNFRFINGTALYTSSFTIPAAPLTAVSGTQLLTCQSPGIIDNSSNSLSMTTVGTPNTSSAVIPPASSGVGADTSGKSNNFGTGNIDQTSGLITYDSLYDTPVDYVDSNGNYIGNYATFNPTRGNTTYTTYTNGNLTAVATNDSVTNFYSVYSTLGFTSGKFYAEYRVDSLGTGTNSLQLGVGTVDYGTGTSNQNGSTTGSTIINLDNSSSAARDILIDSVTTGYAAGTTWGVGDICGIAVDADNNTVKFYKNGVLLNSTAAALTRLPATPQIYFIAYIRYYSTGSGVTANFGQRSFAYTIPTGYKPLNTKNLKDVGSYNLPDSYGNFVNSPDLVWLKSRTSTNSYLLADTVRGSTNVLLSNSTGAPITDTGYPSFLPNGFSVSGTYPEVNSAGNSYVSWNWNKGKIPGFDIVTYGGNSTNSRMIPHNLGVVPAMYITKCLTTYNNTNSYNDWSVWHKSIDVSSYGGNKALYLHSASAPGAAGGFFNNPTANTFGPNQTLYDNVTGQSYIAYLWAEVPGFSKFGIYTGNGSSDGPFIYTGFRPAFILTKNISNSSYWWEIVDSKRGSYNPSSANLYANVTDTEYSGSGYYKDLLSNGFKMRGNTAGSNEIGSSFIYAAFAEVPFKYGNAR